MLRVQQTEYVKPSLSDKDSWSLVLLPDVQTYMKFDYNQPILDLMLAWVSNKVTASSKEKSFGDAKNRFKSFSFLLTTQRCKNIFLQLK